MNLRKDHYRVSLDSSVETKYPSRESDFAVALLGLLSRLRVAVRLGPPAVVKTSRRASVARTVGAVLL